MDLRLADTDQLLLEQARAMLAADAPPERLAEWEDSADGFDRRLWARIVDLGWPGVAFAEFAGGGGGSPASLGVLAGEIGRAAFPSPFLPTVSAGLVAARLGTTKRSTTVLEAICRDGAAATLLWAPGCGSRLEATRRGDLLVVSGRLVADWASAASLLVGLAPVGGPGSLAAVREVAVFAVDAGTPGVTIEARRSFDNERVAVVRLDDVVVDPADHLVDGGAVPADVAAEALGAVRLVRAAELVGIAERTLELTASYVSTRVQFGVPLGTFQAVQHACADVAILVHGAKLLTQEGLSGPPSSHRRAGALAAYHAGRAAVAAAVTGAQLHGGVGMIRDYPLHFYYRRAKAMQLRLGPAAAQLEELARTVVDPVAESAGTPAPWL
ncbi:MAG TPA: acyl-CoA dehydrogenase family protein [Acidimicrobiia bacterium]|nr:acyl-CoA dehydrogenase family protein [Acidimicrobiia bacterium]